MSRGGVRDVLVHAISVVEYNLVYHVHIQKSHVASGCTPPAWLPGFQLDVEVKAGRNLAELA